MVCHAATAAKLVVSVKLASTIGHSDKSAMSRKAAEYTIPSCQHDYTEPGWKSTGVKGATGSLHFLRDDIKMLFRVLVVLQMTANTIEPRQKFQCFWYT